MVPQVSALIWSVLALGCAAQVSSQKEAKSVPAGAEAVTLKTSDQMKAFAYLVHAAEKSDKILLCFHQARSNFWEYEPMAPRFSKLGFDVLAVSQRSGGNMWGHANPTAAQYSDPQDYLAAYPDLEAALTWATEKGYKKIVACGSSYSASLVLKLASEHKEISGVLSFSPGEYFDEKGIVAGWNSKTKVPVLFASTEDESKNGVLNLYDSARSLPGRSLDAIVSDPEGVHGASTLRADKNPKTSAAYWNMVEAFLKQQ